MVDIQAATKEAATVRKATLADVPRISEVLAGAFYDDPPYTWVLHADPRRMNTLKRAFELSLRRLLIESLSFAKAGLLWWTGQGSVGHVGDVYEPSCPVHRQ